MIAPHRPVRRQKIDNGHFRAIRDGAPWAFGDVYYRLMEVGWPAFVGLVTASFLLINLGFGLVYAALPGAIANAAPGSLADGFFFSVETLATVGYGNMAPATHLGHSVAVVEIMLGLFMTATVTGLIFARFSRPRDNLIFSDVAVVRRSGDYPMLMIRLAGIRTRPLADVTAQMLLLLETGLPGGVTLRRFVELPLVSQKNVMLTLAWTLVHVVTPDSPLAAVLDSEDRLRLLVTVAGLDTLLASPSFGSRMYNRGDLRHGHEFVDIIEDLDGGVIHLDLTRLHDTRPAADGPAEDGAAEDGPPTGAAD